MSLDAYSRYNGITSHRTLFTYMDILFSVAYDKNDDGKIQESEFLEYINKPNANPLITDIDHFRRLDTHNENMLAFGDVYDLVIGASQIAKANKEIEFIFREVDSKEGLERDGLLSFKELLKNHKYLTSNAEIMKSFTITIDDSKRVHHEEL